MLCIKLVNYRDKYTEMHGQQNVKSAVMSEIKLGSGHIYTISMPWANLVHFMQLMCSSTAIKID